VRAVEVAGAHAVQRGDEPHAEIARETMAFAREAGLIHDDAAREVAAGVEKRTATFAFAAALLGDAPRGGADAPGSLRPRTAGRVVLSARPPSTVPRREPTSSSSRQCGEGCGERRPALRRRSIAGSGSVRRRVAEGAK
jgi:hypothetical protein